MRGGRRKLIGVGSSDAAVHASAGTPSQLPDSVVVSASPRQQPGVYGEHRRKASHSRGAWGLQAVVVLCAVLLCMPAGGDAQLLTTLQTIGELTTFTSVLMKHTGVIGAISRSSKVTILAPSNAAFAALTEGQRLLILTDAQKSQDFCNLHTITEATVTSRSLVEELGARGSRDYTNDYSTLVSLAVNNNQFTAVAGKSLKHNPALSLKEITLTNGVIHVLDRIIDYLDLGLPTKSVMDAEIMPSYYAEAIRASGVPPPVGATIFAPSDAAFQNIHGITSAAQVAGWPTNVLQHMLQYSYLKDFRTAYNITSTLSSEGGQKGMFETYDGGRLLDVSVQGSKIVAQSATVIATRVGTEGVVHIVDAVLQPQTIALPAYRLWDTESNLPSIYKAAVKQSAMERTLQSTNITVFAPTNSAFSSIGVKSVADLEMYAFESLQRIVQHTLVRGSYSEEIMLQNGSSVVTLATLDAEVPLMAYLNTSQLTVASEGTMARVTSNITATDGVAHIIDTVLLPPGVSPLISTEENTQALTAIDLVLIGSLCVCVFVGGVYVLYTGSMTSYLRKRRHELHTQAEQIRHEAVKDEKMKRAMGKDHGGFKSLCEIEEEKQLSKSLQIPRTNSVPNSARTSPPPLPVAAKGSSQQEPSESSRQLTIDAPHTNTEDDLSEKSYELSNYGPLGSGMLKVGRGGGAPPRPDASPANSTTRELPVKTGDGFVQLYNSPPGHRRGSVSREGNDFSLVGEGEGTPAREVNAPATLQQHLNPVYAGRGKTRHVGSVRAPIVSAMPRHYPSRAPGSARSPPPAAPDIW